MKASLPREYKGALEILFGRGPVVRVALVKLVPFQEQDEFIVCVLGCRVCGPLLELGASLALRSQRLLPRDDSLVVQVLSCQVQMLRVALVELTVHNQERGKLSILVRLIGGLPRGARRTARPGRAHRALAQEGCSPGCGAR